MLSTYLENHLADHITGKASYTAPTAYLALFTADPTQAGVLTSEPTGNGYARVATTAASWAAAASGATSNAATLTFPTATGPWGTLTYFALVDAATAGNVLVSGALAVAKTPTSGDVVSFAVGAVTLTIS